MQVKVMIGGKAGQTIHVGRSQQTFDMIAAGFWEEVQGAPESLLPCHVSPPARPHAPIWKAYQMETSGLTLLEVRLPRGEELSFSGEIGSAAYKSFLNYAGVGEPPQAVMDAYLSLRQEPLDPYYVREMTERRRLEVEEKNRTAERNANAAIAAGKY